MEWICPKCGKIDKRFGLHQCSSVSSSELDSIFSEAEKIENEGKKKKYQEVKQSPESSICPHCEESISVNAIVCPYCAENVKNTSVTASSANTDKAGITLNSPAKEEVVIEKTIKNKSLSSIEIDPVKAKMQRLEALLADGIITHEEFNNKRQQIISGFLEAEEGAE